jgi:lincosamide nucleotidyltransferase A/C/D/E
VIAQAVSQRDGRTDARHWGIRHRHALRDQPGWDSGSVPTNEAGMTDAEAAEIVAWLEARQATYQVNGGWAVDALLGRQTRTHQDLDVFVDAEVVDELLAWLHGRDYVVAENWLPVRIELVAPHGRVDVHPMTIQANGDGIQKDFGDESFTHAAKDRALGMIGGGTVVVASAARLRELRQGYAQREVDVHDLAVLQSL